MCGASGKPELLYRKSAEQERLASLIDLEARRYDEASPIVRGPAHLSHALLRIIASDAYAADLRSAAGSSGRGRQALAEFIIGGLEQHADDRGQHYRAKHPAIKQLMDQLEVWAKELAAEKADPKRIRIAIQLTLAEELASSIAYAVRSGN